jgi:hypothetical protein
MAAMKRYLRATWMGCVIAGLLGCANVVPALPLTVAAQETVVIGHVITVLMGPTTRIYTPELRFFELFHRSSHERFRVKIHSDDSWFVVALPPGTYELTRIMVNEGAFQEAAGLNMTFQVAEGQINYVGTWRLGVEIPQYERMLLVSAVSENEDVVRKSYRLIRRHGAVPS